MPDLLLEPWRQRIPTATVQKPETVEQAPIEAQLITDTTALNSGADAIVTARYLQAMVNKQREAKLSTTPKLNGLQDAFAAFTTRVEAAAQKLTERMDTVAVTTETAVTKFGSAVDKVEAQAKAIDDAANQITNGGPPLGNS